MVDRKTLGEGRKEEINKYKSVEYSLCIGTRDLDSNPGVTQFIETKI